MNETPHLTPQEVIDLYKTEFGAGIIDARITERGEGVHKTKGYDIWIRLDRELLKPAIKKLMDIRFPLPSWSCASGHAASQAVFSMTRTTLTGRSTRCFPWTCMCPAALPVRRLSSSGL